jgi:polysaccharide chain length determinant protein (PEP-CTERM system associated)
MDKNQYQLLKKYADLLLRWDKVIIVVVLAAISCGFVVYLKTPKVYQSSSLIMYEQQQIKPSILTPEVTKKIEVMVNTVSQHVTSRGSLESIVKEFDLYKDALKKLPVEDVIVIMRDKYIDIVTDKKSGDVFQVSFENEDPRKAMLVTNALASKFIEENLRFREERASETTDYVQYELKIAKETIDKKEALMRDYKLNYYNEMPDQRVGNMNRLNALQEQYQVVQSNIQNLEQTRLLVQQQNDLQKKNLVRTTGEAENNPDIYDLETARQAMKNLLAKYTPEHPSVKQLAKQIRQLEEEQAQSQNSSPRDGEKKGSDDSPMSGQLTGQLKEIELNLKSLRSHGDKILEQVRKYQQWVDNTPVREAEWASITRDYYELKKHYENLVSQSLAAESAETLERRQKGSQFRIVDSAYLPVKPLEPDFFKIMLSSLALGLGGGVALILFFDFLDTSFKDANEVEHFLKLPVLCSVPMIVTPKEKKRSHVISLLSYFFSVLFFIGLVSVMVFFWQKGVVVI